MPPHLAGKNDNGQLPELENKHDPVDDQDEEWQEMEQMNSPKLKFLIDFIHQGLFRNIQQKSFTFSFDSPYFSLRNLSANGEAILSELKVDDIMVPRGKLIALDLAQPIDVIIRQILASKHRYLPVFKEDICNLLGVLDIKTILWPLYENKTTKEVLESLLILR